MSTTMDVIKIPEGYKNLNYYEDHHIPYGDDEYCVYTLCCFNRVNIITELFNITYSKRLPCYDFGGLFSAMYLITLEDFLKAKDTYTSNCKNQLIKEYMINEDDESYVREDLEDFFNTIEPIIRNEKKLIFSIDK